MASCCPATSPGALSNPEGKAPFGARGLQLAGRTRRYEDNVSDRVGFELALTQVAEILRYDSCWIRFRQARHLMMQ